MSKGKAPGSPLLSLMADVANDPSAAAGFAENPDALMDKHGLSDEHKGKLRSALGSMKKGDTHAMRDLVGGSVVHPDTCFVITVP